MASLPANAHPWQAAFVAFCNGAPEDEISQIFEIPLTSLKQRMAVERWAKLREEVMSNAVARAQSSLPSKTEARLRLIEENRLENLDAFAKLRKHAVEIIGALAERRLKLEKQKVLKDGKVVRFEVDPGPGDWVNISTYLTAIANGTYRALGDFAAQEKPGSDAVAGAPTPSAPAITIILPGAIAHPREDRRLEEAKEGQVIDLRPLVEDAEPKTS